MSATSPETLEDTIGHRFARPELLLEALTHSSYSRETPKPHRDNEQLEFLGDAVLNFVVSVRLAETFPQFAEGKLSRARARLVSTDHLSEIAADLRLGNYLRLGRGEEMTGGRAKARLLVNALEALIAAIYRDGGLSAAAQFITRFILPPDLNAAGPELLSIDYKSALQEHLQAVGARSASYRVVSEEGPEHRKTFIVEAVVNSGPMAVGRGQSKKAAEQQAARAVLEQLLDKERQG